MAIVEVVACAVEAARDCGAGAPFISRARPGHERDQVLVFFSFMEEETGELRWRGVENLVAGTKLFFVLINDVTR